MCFVLMLRMCIYVLAVFNREGLRMSGSYHHSSENSSHYGQSPNTTHYGRPPNTSHYGNGQSSHYGQPPTNHYGIASNMYANVNVNYEIPDQSGYASGMNPMPSPISSGCYEFQVNQKLDQLLGLVNSQKTETTKLQSEINKLKQDVQDLRATKATVSSSNKLPLDLSVRMRHGFVLTLCVCCVFIFLWAKLVWRC